MSDATEDTTAAAAAAAAAGATAGAGGASRFSKRGDYVHFDALPSGGPLNRWSQNLTRGHDHPGAQAMLYAAGVPNQDMMKNAPQVGIATVWWEGNPCK